MCWELQLHKSVDQYLNDLAMICVSQGEGPELKPELKPSGHTRSSVELLLHNQLH